MSYFNKDYFTNTLEGSQVSNDTIDSMDEFLMFEGVDLDDVEIDDSDDDSDDEDFEMESFINNFL
jgi:hypothetical protein